MRRHAEQMRREREQSRALRDQVRRDAECTRAASQAARHAGAAARRLVAQSRRAVAEQTEILRVMRATVRRLDRPVGTNGDHAERRAVADPEPEPDGSVYEQLLDRIASAGFLDELELLRAAAHAYFITDARFATIERMIEGKIKVVRAKRALDREVR
ncbi:MAG TPA: hypothetical protein VM076_19275 [Gemmatimonadaceae bacterium]|nr:hypothetical protein [Gemmatimonadaceae bacterium]